MCARLELGCDLGPGRQGILVEVKVACGRVEEPISIAMEALLLGLKP
jgi:hypothetical protein